MGSNQTFFINMSCQAHVDCYEGQTSVSDQGKEITTQVIGIKLMPVTTVFWNESLSI